FGEFHRGLLDAGDDVARLDEDYLHAKGIQFQAQSVAHGLEREFAAAVGALRRSSHETRDGTHHYDTAALAFAHVRQHGLRDAQYAEKISFELAPPVLHAQVFDRGRKVHAGIVEEKIDGARLC